MTEWIPIDPDDPAHWPEQGPRCPGIHLDKVAETNRWKLYVEEGKVTLTSGCQECDEVVWGPVGGEDIQMDVPVVGHLVSHVERYVDDVDHWWVFVPEVIERAD